MDRSASTLPSNGGRPLIQCVSGAYPGRIRLDENVFFLQKPFDTAPLAAKLREVLADT